MQPDSFSTRRFSHEVLRKILHLPAFVFPLLAIYSRIVAIFILASLIFFYVALLFIEKKYSKKILGVNDLITLCKRSEKIDPAPAYLALGLLLCVVFFPAYNVFYAAYVIAISDSAAALVGMRFGRHPIGKFSKSWEGSLAFFILSFVGGVFFLSPLAALVTAFCLTTAEILCGRGTDNFILPLLSQVLLYLFHLIFHTTQGARQFF